MVISEVKEEGGGNTERQKNINRVKGITRTRRDEFLKKYMTLETSQQSDSSAMFAILTKITKKAYTVEMIGMTTARSARLLNREWKEAET